MKVNNELEAASDLIPRVTNEKKEANESHFHLAHNKLKECYLAVESLNSIVSEYHQNKRIGIGIVLKKNYRYYIVLEIDEDKKVKSIKYGREGSVDYNYAHIASWVNDLFKGATLNHVEEVDAIYMKDPGDLSRGYVHREYPDAKKFAFGYALGYAIKECKRKKLQSKTVTFDTMSLMDIKSKLKPDFIVLD